MAKAVGFRPATAARILKRAGMVGSKQTPEWTRPPGGSGGAINVKWFRLLEDATSFLVEAREVNFNVETGSFSDLDPLPDPIDIVNWDSLETGNGLLEHAQEGYVAQCVLINDQWGFHQGSCLFPPEEE